MAGPGQPKTGGRKRGTPNKFTRDLRGMIREALDKEGGVKYLRRCANEQPVAFLGLVSRLLPAELRASVEADTTLLIFRNYTGIEWEEAARQRALTGEPPPLLPGVPESVPVVDIGQSLPVEEPSPEERPTRKVAKLEGGKVTGKPLIRETPRRGRAIL